VPPTTEYYQKKLQSTPSTLLILKQAFWGNVLESVLTLQCQNITPYVKSGGEIPGLS
jgi:hypothetical protein